MQMTMRDGRQLAALTIAGSDSGGNAGVQADIRAFHTFGLHACTVFSSLTAQNPSGVSGVHVPPPEFIAAQLDAVLGVYGIGAAKTGMLGTRASVECVAAKLREHPDLPVVVDPVMVASSGARLLDDDAVAAVKNALLPVAALATPNIPEAETLTGLSIRDRAGMLRAARAIADSTGRAALVKGGHHIGRGEADSAVELACDVLVCTDGEFLFSSPVVENPLSTHGTGCSLSAAIAAAIACGAPLPRAVAAGKAYVYEAIKTSVRVGDSATVLGMPDAPDFFNHPEIEISSL